jgi:hypothetical protein
MEGSRLSNVTVKTLAHEAAPQSCQYGASECCTECCIEQLLCQLCLQLHPMLAGKYPTARRGRHVPRA